MMRELSISDSQMIAGGLSNLLDSRQVGLIVDGVSYGIGFTLGVALAVPAAIGLALYAAVYYLVYIPCYYIGYVAGKTVYTGYNVATGNFS
jgi:hypothetical protein